MPTIHPVLLAGGSGTRLWPLSRTSYPKQFSKLIGVQSLFQSTAQRLTSSDIIDFEQHVTVTNSDFRYIASEQLQEAGIDPGPILIEPESKNTAAAILAASIFMHANDQDAVLLVAPSDHLIPDKRDFHEAVKTGLQHVQNGSLVAFGINPARPETGYGYIEISKQTLDPSDLSNVERFIEKPDLHSAMQMLDSENFLWNAGIFLFRAHDMITAFNNYASDELDLVSKSIADASTVLGFLCLASEPWSALENISIDYAIMEKVQNLFVVPYLSKWSDLGGWDSIWSEGDPDASGNVISDAAHAVDCKNSLLRSESEKQQIVGVGLDNILAIAMPDAVLVAHKDRAQDIKKAVSLLSSKAIDQADVFPLDYRPWGWFESLLIEDHFQVKRIYVKPGASLSLQSHKHRSEHWVVVDGVARVTVDKQVKFISEGQSVYVPLGAVHRLENPGELPLTIIEVQIGSYLGEDDIIRYQDNYLRG